MPDIITIDKSAQNSCEAEGHPTECQEPVSGQVVQDSTHNVTITNASGETKQIASVNSATMQFDSHAHDYDAEFGCQENASHSIDPSNGVATITINGSPVYAFGTDVATDPKSGDAINFTDTGVNNSITSDIQ